MNPKYVVRHQHGEDYAVVDERGVERATGLSEEEAKETARAWNERAEKGKVMRFIQWLLDVFGPAKQYTVSEWRARMEELNIVPAQPKKENEVAV